MWEYILGILFVLATFLAIQYKIDINNAYKRLNNYDIKIIYTDYGKMSYMDEGTGETIIISHGIFGGYDQAYVSLKSLVGDHYRKITPSRFGYPGSDLPSQPTPENQAKAFLNLLDQLGIQKTYIITTSAGGAAGIMFATEYPRRVKGLILVSSGVPTAKKARKDIKGMMGPPAPFVNDFPMWFSTKYFGFVFKTMFASEIDNSMYETMLPVEPRKKGIKIDETITNIDMDVNFDDYDITKITAPILVVHAKDDPMAKYESAEKLITRTNAKTAVFETGGHLITGHGDAVSIAIKEFIEKTK
jgi:pimeloyl-ACP methyl ester carboxylesterase